MKITNKTNLPDAIVNYRHHVENTKYSSGGADYSVTTLIDSPRTKILSKQHYKEMEKDASEDIFAMLGTAMHHIVEAGATFDHVKEERLFTEVDGKSISGQIDLQEIRRDNSIDIIDFKVSSVWAAIIDGMKKREWISQLNMYAELVERSKRVKVNSINVCCLFRDWSKTESKRRADYPKAAIQRADLPLWTKAERGKFLSDRVATHIKASEMYADNKILPRCTDEERWHRPGKVALMKRDRKTALKLFDSKPDLLAWAERAGYTGGSVSTTSGGVEKLLKPVYSIEIRPTKYVRCDDWCNVSQWCSQLAADKLLEAMEEREQEGNDKEA